MSSIAYLADENMLDFHRIHGNRHINFWRTGVRNFEYFEPGDLLFFIDGKHRHPYTREKGIIGYGVFKQLRQMSVKRTWNQYKEENGFSSYQHFLEGVLQTTKDDKLPEKIQSIELDNVIYFKHPIYLGEFTSPININLESFIYLEDTISEKLLNHAYSSGIDTWYQLENPNLTVDKIAKDIEVNHLRSVLSEIKIDWTHEQRRIINQYPAFNRVENLAYLVKDEGIEIFIPVSSPKNQYYTVLGIIYKIKTEIAKDTQFTLIVRENARSFEEEFSKFGLKLLYT